jgi:acyl-CoA synthetase (AMP-forming)/AMP-acid ligase II
VADVAGRFTKPSSVSLFSLPLVDALFPSLGAFKPSAQFDVLPPLDRRADYATACIYHSSGSTAWPKPIHFTERSALTWLCAHEYGDYSFGPVTRLGAIGLPIFHILGFCSTIIYPFATGTQTTIFRPANRSEASGIEVPLADTIIKAAAESQCNVLFTTPAVLTVRDAFAVDPPYMLDVHNPDLLVDMAKQDVRRDPVKVKMLAGLDFVMFGGGPLDNNVGDQLVSNGVKLCSGYAS